jgi:hypothetical protein
VLSLLNQTISTKKGLIESFRYLRIHYYIFYLPRNGALFNIWDSIQKKNYSRLSRSFYEVRSQFEHFILTKLYIFGDLEWSYYLNLMEIYMC